MAVPTIESILGLSVIDIIYKAHCVLFCLEQGKRIRLASYSIISVQGEIDDLEQSKIVDIVFSQQEAIFVSESGKEVRFYSKEPILISDE